MQFEAMLVLVFATLPTQGWQNSLAVRWRVGKHAMALLHALGRRAGSRGDQRLGVAPTFDAGSRVLLRTWRWACARVCLPLLQTPRPPYNPSPRPDTCDPVSICSCPDKGNSLYSHSLSPLCAVSSAIALPQNPPCPVLCFFSP